jgi:hypothetical protein
MAIHLLRLNPIHNPTLFSLFHSTCLNISMLNCRCSIHSPKFRHRLILSFTLKSILFLNPMYKLSHKHSSPFHNPWLLSPARLLILISRPSLSILQSMQ